MPPRLDAIFDESRIAQVLSNLIGKQRSLPMWKQAAREIRDWLSLNLQLEAGSALLPRRDGGPMTRANVTQRLKLAVAAATACHPELLTMSVLPQMVRHWTAMWVFRSIVPTDSGPSCPAIPVDRAHPFRSIVPSLRP